MMTYRISDVRALCALLCVLLQYSRAMQDSYGLELPEEEYITQELECEPEMLQTDEGIYSFVSDGEPRFCSLYVVAPLDRVVQFQFSDFDVSCVDGAAVALLDGWEVDRAFFPREEDHVQPMANRYVQFCGDYTPTGVYSAKQNAAQIQFFIPNSGDGFSVRISFKKNWKPCNMLLMGKSMEGLTLKNYGLKRNCSVLSFFPQEINFSWFNVGERRRHPFIFAEDVQMDTGLRTMCRDGRSTDQVELYQGLGVGEVGRNLVLGFCGRRLHKVPHPITLACESTTVRLVSSGKFYNSINFSLRPVEDNERTC